MARSNAPATRCASFADLLRAGEMHRRRAALHGDFDGVAAIDRQLHLVQVRHLADRGRNDRRRRGTAGARLAEFAFHLADAAGEGGIDDAVERQVRGVRDHRDHVGELDAFLALRIERQLADLAARGEAVAAEQRESAARASGAMVRPAPRISSSIRRAIAWRLSR